MVTDTIRPSKPDSAESTRSAEDTSIAVSLKNLSKTFPGNHQRAVHDLSLDIANGEILTLLGPSGCGKTTTMRMVAGLENPDEGSIYFGNDAVALSDRNFFMAPEKRDVGMMFQSYAIWPHMTVSENVAFPLKARGFPRKQVKPRVEWALELVGMSGFEDRPGPMLSGGQQQRVAMARAIVTEPRILLLDEPFSALDAKRREQMRVEVKQLQQRLGIAVLFVTHDQIEALSLSDRVALLQDGVIQQIGAPRDLYEKPVNEFVRDFVGQTLIFEGRVDDIIGNGFLSVHLCESQECVVKGYSVQFSELGPGSIVKVAVRPDDIGIVPTDQVCESEPHLQGRIVSSLFMGEWYECWVDVCNQGVITVHASRHVTIRDGDNVILKIFPHGHTVWPS